MSTIQFAIGEDNNPRNMRHLMYFKLKVGDSLYVDRRGWGTVAVAPRMLMTPIGGPGGLCLISGGTALVGQLSIIDEMLINPEGEMVPNITLIHSNRSSCGIPFYNKLGKLAEAGRITYILRITGSEQSGKGQPKFSQRGRIDLDLLKEVLPGKRLFCVCGSGPMVEGIVRLLLQAGVWPGSIRTDYTTRVDPAAKKVKTNQSNENAAKRNEKSNLSGNNRLNQGKRLAFAETPDGTHGESNLSKDFDCYFTETGMKQFFEQNMEVFKKDKPKEPFQFWIKKLKLHLERFPEVVNENAKYQQFWLNYWETDNVKWQSPIVSPWLKKFRAKFLGEKRALRVFVPLCGKSADMLWLSGLGHSVIGCDCSAIALQDFFTTNQKNKNYARKVVKKADKKGGEIAVHTSDDMPNLRLLESDILEVTSATIGGEVDCILDRAALTALHPSMVELYLHHLLSLLKRSTDSRVMLASVSRLPFPVAPPHVWKPTQIEPLLGKYFGKVTLLTVHKYKVNAGEVHEPIYLLQQPRPEILFE